MLEKLNSAKNVLLVEPPYPRKYPPLGLAKIKTYLEKRNTKTMYSRNIIPFEFDLICVTSLFTYYSQDVFNVLKNRGLFNNDTPILVGGVFASLMPEQFEDKKNVFVFKGYSKTLDKCIPHINLMNTVEKPWDTFSYVFTSRGCPNKCLEGNTIINTVEGDIPIKDLVGKEIGVYTYSPITKEVFITKAIHIREMGIKKLVRVHFDDDTFIDCTPDHRFLTFKNANQFSVLTERETEAKDLLKGTSVRALRITDHKQGYKIVNWGRRKRKLQHRLVAEYKIGRKLLAKEVVHHKDQIKSHNLIDNIEVFSGIKEHCKNHPEIAERMRKNNPQRFCTEESYKKIAEKITGQKRGLSTRLKHRELMLGEKNPNYVHGKTCGQKSRIEDINHKVVKIEFLEVPKMTYDMEVPKTSWFFANNVLVHNCAYCSVWKIERERWVNDSWKDHVFMDRPNIMISDNNLSAVTFDHLKEIIDFSLKHKKKLLFDNGFDCKYITKEMALELGKVQFIRNGMRMAFDRIEEDGVFQKAVETLVESGVHTNSLMAYVLFNFTDRPKDADFRARECVRLGVRPYPQYYRPLNVLNKETIFVGKHWTLQLGRAFRHFWLMRGLNSKMNFGIYVKSKSGRHMHELTDKDIEIWDNNGVKE